VGYASREDFYRRRYEGNDVVLPQEKLDALIEKSSATLSAVLDDLRRSPVADRLVVFGSMARGSFLPGDVDVAIDLRSVPPVDELALHGLLRTARKHYGWVDVFVIEQDGNLLVRNEQATAWTNAKGARALKAAIAAEGKPLSEVTYVVDPAPASYEPVPWEVDRFRNRWAALMTEDFRPEVRAGWQRRHLIATIRHPYPEVNELFEEFAAAVPDAISDGIDGLDSGRPSPCP